MFLAMYAESVGYVQINLVTDYRTVSTLIETNYISRFCSTSYRYCPCQDLHVHP
jgi:hypothetical protein